MGKRLWAISGLSLIFVSVFQQLKAIADLRFVKAVRIICWLSRSCYRLLTWAGWWLIWRIVTALRLIKCSLFVIVGLSAPWLTRVGLRNVTLSLLLLCILLMRLLHIWLCLIGLLVLPAWLLSWVWPTHSMIGRAHYIRLIAILFDEGGWRRCCSIEMRIVGWSLVWARYAMMWTYLYRLWLIAELLT